MLNHQPVNLSDFFWFFTQFINGEKNANYWIRITKRKFYHNL